MITAFCVLCLYCSMRRAGVLVTGRFGTRGKGVSASRYLRRPTFTMNNGIHAIKAHHISPMIFSRVPNSRYYSSSSHF